MDLREKTAAWLEESGCTKAELAARIDYPATHLCNWLAGHRGLPYYIVERILDIVL